MMRNCIRSTLVPVTLLLLMERERSKQQPLPHDGVLADSLLKAATLGKSLMAIPVTKPGV